MSGHGHSHGHSHGGLFDDHKEFHDHTHDLALDDPLSGDIYSLYKNINTDNLTCLNEEVPGSVKKVFKPFDKRLDKTEFIKSDADPELIIYIPFAGQVKLKSFCIIGGPQGESPSKIKLFVNRDDIDFGTVEDLKPTQSLDLVENLEGEIDWPVQVYNFNNVSSLTMYIPENFGADNTTISYIGLKGEFAALKREAVVANYEIRPQAAKNDPSAQSQVNSALH